VQDISETVISTRVGGTLEQSTTQSKKFAYFISIPLPPHVPNKVSKDNPFRKFLDRACFSGDFNICVVFAGHKLLTERRMYHCSGQI
jgi:hypothetical protein